MYDVWFSTLKTLEPTEALTGAIKGLKAEYASGWKPPEIRPGGGIEEILGIPSDLGKQLPGLVDANSMMPPGIFDGFATDMVANLSASILRAIEGGGDILKAAGSTIGSYMLDPKQSNRRQDHREASRQAAEVYGGCDQRRAPDCRRAHRSGRQLARQTRS